MSTIARNRGRKSFRLINNSELLNITDQIYLIIVLSMRYTFICDIYGNPNFFNIIYSSKNLRTTCYLFLDIRNSPEDDREALKETTQKRLERTSF